MSNPFRYFNSSPEVIRLVVMMYVRYPLAQRRGSGGERGIDISHETIPCHSAWGPNADRRGNFLNCLREERSNSKVDSQVKGTTDPDAPLSKYGLQSIDAVILAMEIEEEVGVELPPTLLWEYNTANECAAYLMTLGPAIAA
jgi:acyl carrier protein